MAEFGKLNFSTSFNRTSAFPLEANSYFTSYAEAEAAAKTAVEVGSADSTYYIGLILTVVEGEETKCYVILPNKTLKELGNNKTNKIFGAPIETQLPGIMGAFLNKIENKYYITFGNIIYESIDLINWNKIPLKNENDFAISIASTGSSVIAAIIDVNVKNIPYFVNIIDKDHITFYDPVLFFDIKENENIVFALVIGINYSNKKDVLLLLVSDSRIHISFYNNNKVRFNHELNTCDYLTQPFIVHNLPIVDYKNNRIVLFGNKGVTIIKNCLDFSTLEYKPEIIIKDISTNYLQSLVIHSSIEGHSEKYLFVTSGAYMYLSDIDFNSVSEIKVASPFSGVFDGISAFCKHGDIYYCNAYSKNNFYNLTIRLIDDIPIIEDSVKTDISYLCVFNNIEEENKILFTTITSNNECKIILVPVIEKILTDIGLTSKGVGLIYYEGSEARGEIFNSYLRESNVVPNIASGIGSHAEGESCVASGDFSHVEGRSNHAVGNRSHAEGYDNKAIGQDSHVEGNSNIASGELSHAEGYKTTTIGDHSHAEGGSALSLMLEFDSPNYTIDLITSNTDHLIGYYSECLSTKGNAFTVAYGKASHASGKNTMALGVNSFTAGYGTIAYDDNSFVCGTFNAKNPKSLFLVGFGTADNNRRDAFRVMTDGHTYANIIYASEYYENSDKILKDNIQPISSNNPIELVLFNWKDTGKKSYGVIALQIEENYPELVDINEDTGLKTVNYNAVYAIKIALLENRINELELKIKEYE